MLNSLLEVAKKPTYSARGPLSEAVRSALTGQDIGEDHRAIAALSLSQCNDLTHDDDVQFALFLLYMSHTGSLDELLPDLEWNPSLIETRQVLERAFEAELREQLPVPELPVPESQAVARALFDLANSQTGPSTAKYFAKQATREQAIESLMQRSIYTLREADPHSWAIPRLTGRPKAALVEIQTDEYGSGRPERLHATIFARSMRGAGLSDVYGEYLDQVPAVTLASHNVMSMFGMNRRLLGAIVGHLAAFEMTSSIPCRLYSDGFRRLGFDEDVTDYFDEHVEADAVHEQLAAHDLAGSLAEDRPDLLPDIMFGARACLAVEGEMSNHMLRSWQRGESSLRNTGVGWSKESMGAKVTQCSSVRSRIDIETSRDFETGTEGAAQ